MRALPLAAALAIACSGSDRAEPMPQGQRDAIVPAISSQPIVEPIHPPMVGVLVAGSAIDVVSTVGGTVREIEVSMGDEVASGGALLVLDDSELAEELAMAEADQRAARAALRQASVDVRLARLEMKTERKLHRAGATSSRNRDRARLAYQRARAVRARLSAELEQRAERIAQLERRRSEATVRAPFSGTVAARYVAPGQRVAPGQAVVRLVGAGPLRVRFAVPSAQAAQLEVGTEARVQIEALELAVQAVVRHVSPEVDWSTQLTFVEAELDQAPTSLQAGMVARVTLVDREHGAI